MSENRESCEMVRHPDGSHIYRAEFSAGAFAWHTRDGYRCIRFKTPGPNYGNIIVYRSGEPLPSVQEPVWSWDGDEDKPTLSPSVHCVGYWHGYFVQGRMQSC